MIYSDMHRVERTIISRDANRTLKSMNINESRFEIRSPLSVFYTNPISTFNIVGKVATV